MSADCSWTVNLCPNAQCRNRLSLIEAERAPSEFRFFGTTQDLPARVAVGRGEHNISPTPDHLRLTITDAAKTGFLMHMEKQLDPVATRTAKAVRDRDVA